ncbi:MAG: hypothetical protein AUJ24_02130 [Parcubacteria group bacterium CG1_02_36_42]|nr:MAG: hypothetical protein AUJ24_02130 [Parcubacteria group bacterium CG1_02_36_42]
MNESERIFIIIDGNNFYHRLKELNFKNLLSFDYEKFAKFLIRGEKIVISKNYYIGAVREERNNPKSKELMIGQRKLTGKLRKNGWVVKFGQLLKDGDYHEKGVDVQIAVDLLIGAYENLYDTAILVSSDTDLTPALIKVPEMKKKVEYIGFSHKPSYGLITHSDIRRLLTKEDIEQFFL